MFKVQNTDNIKCWPQSGEKETLNLHLWEYKMVQPYWKIISQFLEKLTILLPSSIHAPWYFPK
jgi:hypothetical protein